jgi:hypothetical protein
VRVMVNKSKFNASFDYRNENLPLCTNFPLLMIVGRSLERLTDHLYLILKVSDAGFSP